MAVVCLVGLTLFATNASAEDLASGTCGDNLTWVLTDDGTLTISGEGAMLDYKTSSNTAPWFTKRTKIASVIIEDGVTSIGGHAFFSCLKLERITIADTVTSIGEGAFKDCTKLTAITIPDGVNSIDYSAFRGCTGLTSITIPDSVTSIEWNVFEGCSSLTSITIPDSVTSIGDSAFSGCTSLTSITIPDSVTSISEGAFYGCTSLTSVTILEGVTSIGEFAFSNCTSLTSITIPDGVTSIGEDAFYNCSSLWHVLYKGTEEAWNAISIGRSNWELTSATRHYNCTGDEVTDPVDKVCKVCSGACDHTWIDATCSTPKTCGICKATEGDALGHQEIIDEAVAPTCTDDGLSQGIRCAVCEEILAAQETVPALGHSMDLWYMEIAPTCTETGLIRRDCDRCDYFENGGIVAIGHDYTSAVTEPTCTEQGYTTRTCANCGDSYVENYVDAAGHTWDEGVVTKEPTADTEGVRTYTCTVCGDTKTESIPKTENDDEIDALQGDVNGDGKVDTTDAKLIMQFDLGIIDESALNLSVADVNGDGKIDTTDAKLIMQLDLGIITEFPKP